jgi:hypothetical protein
MIISLMGVAADAEAQMPSPEKVTQQDESIEKERATA